MSHSTTKSGIGEMWLRHLLEKLPAGAYTCDAEGLITYFNQRAVEVWGRTPKLNEPEERFCGSFKLYSIDGTPIYTTDAEGRLTHFNPAAVEFSGHAPELGTER